jgi:hypothetical protein
MQLKGSVEFRNNPGLRGEIILNSKMKLVELKAGLFLHIKTCNVICFANPEIQMILLNHMLSSKIIQVSCGRISVDSFIRIFAFCTSKKKIKRETYKI